MMNPLRFQLPLGCSKLRFSLASIYKNFRETRDFEMLIGELEGDEVKD